MGLKDILAFRLQFFRSKLGMSRQIGVMTHDHRSLRVYRGQVVGGLQQEWDPQVRLDRLDLQEETEAAAEEIRTTTKVMDYDLSSHSLGNCSRGSLQDNKR